MNNYPVTEGTAPALPNQEENVLAGVVGAFLFSLAGGALWFVLYQLGFLAGISGIIGVICAIKGYEVFAKKSSIKGIVISVIMAFLVLVIAWYLCLSLDVYQAYAEWFKMGEIDYEITFADAVLGSYIYLFDPATALSYWGDLAIGLLLCGVGCFTNIRGAVSKTKAAKVAADEPADVVWTTAEPVDDIDDDDDDAIDPPAQPKINAEVEGTLN